MAAYATMSALDVWYEHIDLKQLIKRMPEAEYRIPVLPVRKNQNP